MYINNLEDGHYVMWKPNKKGYSKHKPCPKFDINSKRVGKHFFNSKELNEIFNLIRSNDWETAMLGWRMIHNSKTAKHYAISYSKVSDYVKYKLNILGRYHNNAFAEDSNHPRDFMKWLNRHTIFVQGTSHAL